MTDARFNFDFDCIFSTPANPRIERLMTDLEKVEDDSRSSAAADLSTVLDAELTARPASTKGNKDV